MQYAHVDKPNDNKPITIEVAGEPQGVVIPGDEGFRFLAVRLDAFPIDGRVFPSLAAARDAVRSAVRDAR